MVMKRKLAKISGRVTDFRGKVIVDAEVEIMGCDFKTLYKTHSDASGRYKILVKPGTYLALMACKDYKSKNLEYWVWNVPAYKDLKINPRIDGLEIYAMNAFIPQTPIRSIMIYFRPMSLKRVQNQGGVDVVKKMKLVDIAPKILPDDIEIKINGVRSEILEISSVNESAGKGKQIISYLIQCALRKEYREEYLRIDLSLFDRETKEKGAGCLFLKVPDDGRFSVK